MFYAVYLYLRRWRYWKSVAILRSYLRRTGRRGLQLSPLHEVLRLYWFLPVTSLIKRTLRRHSRWLSLDLMSAALGQATITISLTSWYTARWGLQLLSHTVWRLYCFSRSLTSIFCTATSPPNIAPMFMLSLRLTLHKRCARSVSLLFHILITVLLQFYQSI